MSARPVSQARLRVLSLVDGGRLRAGNDFAPIVTDGDAFSKAALTAARRRGEVGLNLVSFVFYLTERGRDVLSASRSNEGATR